MTKRTRIGEKGRIFRSLASKSETFRNESKPQSTRDSDLGTKREQKIKEIRVLGEKVKNVRDREGIIGIQKKEKMEKKKKSWDFKDKPW